MRRIKYIAICCCLLILSIFNSFAQKVELKRERVFTGPGLYGFMNGGADLYLEYGVQELIVRDIVYEGEKYSIEVYDMPSSEDAFGIYSLHTFRCERADTLGCINCLSPYQLQAVADNSYVSIVFHSGSDAAKKMVDDVIRMYVNMEQKSKPDIPDLLQIELPISGKLKYLRGPISVSSASSSLAQLVEDTTYTGIWFRQEQGSKKYFALIQFPDSDNTLRIKEKIPASGLIKAGDDYLYIMGEEKPEEDEDFGVFGF